MPPPPLTQADDDCDESESEVDIAELLLTDGHLDDLTPAPPATRRLEQLQDDDVFGDLLVGKWLLPFVLSFERDVTCRIRL